MRTVSLREIIMFSGSIIMAYFLFVKGCRSQDEIDGLVQQISQYKDSAQFYKIKVNGHDVQVAYNQSLALQNEKQLRAVLAKNDTLIKLLKKFNNVASTTIINQYTTISGDTIRTKDSIPCDFKPFQVKRDSIHYYFSGTIGRNFFSIDSLIIPNKQSIIIGEKRLGFLRGKEKRIEIVNSNPLIHTNRIQNYVIDPHKKWYKTTAFKFFAGAATGIIIHRHVTK